MKSIGFRCWDDRYAFVMLSGTQNDPKLEMSDHRTVPADLTRPQQLAWLRKDIHEVLYTGQPDAGALRSMEPFARTKSVKRVQLDAIVLEGAVSHDISLVLAELAKAQLKIHMGLKGSIDEGQWLQIFERIDSLAKTNYLDAALASLAMLPRP